MSAMGIVEKSLAGDNNPIADHVATIGQDKMRLLPGAQVESTRLADDPKGEVVFGCSAADMICSTERIGATTLRNLQPLSRRFTHCIPSPHRQQTGRKGE